MPVYEYKAYNVHGKAYKSYLESTTISLAKLKLNELGIPFTEIWEKRRLSKKRVKKETLLQFTSELSQLLNADLPLYESLELLKQQFHNDAFFPILREITEGLKGGQSFSEALKNYPSYFNSFFCTLVEMGEQSGYLCEALERIKKELERECKIKKQIQSALLYPSILLTFCCALISLLIFYIVPSIETLFETSNTHAFTKAVIEGSHHLKKFGLFYLLSLVVLVWLTKILIQKPKWKMILDRLLLRAPILSSLIKEIIFARWTSNMAMLLLGDVPLLDALKLSSSLIQNLVLRKDIEACIKKVREGNSMSSELKKSGNFPPLLTRMLLVGESTGELASSFDKLAALYEDGVDKKMGRFLTLLSPIILIFMATLIGVIMLSILIPLTDINSFSI